MFLIKIYNRSFVGDGDGVPAAVAVIFGSFPTSYQELLSFYQRAVSFVGLNFELKLCVFYLGQFC